MSILGEKAKLGTGRIKDGALIGQDFRVMHWPNCLVPPSLEKNWPADIIFDVYEFDADNVSCIAPGFGVIGGDYGNGSLFVKKKIFFGKQALAPRQLSGKRRRGAGH
jgi:hypothetical protein